LIHFYKSIKMGKSTKRMNGARGAAEAIEYSPIGKLFHWVDPVASGVTLLLGIVLIVCLAAYSIISIVSNVLLLAVLGGVGCKVYVHMMGFLKKPCKDPLAQLALLDVSCTEECIAPTLNSIVQSYNSASNQMRSLLLGEDLYASVKFGLVLYLLTIFGSVFNAVTLLGVAWVLSFLLPRIYEDNQDALDENWAKIVDQYHVVDAKLAALCPISAMSGDKKVEVAPASDKEE
jgi:hypothetical protein